MLENTHLYQQIVFYRDMISFYLKYGRHYQSKMEAWMKKEHEPIPKVIHYCWFSGDAFGEMQQRCIESWKKHLPGWEFKLWNMDNFPFERYPFAARALKDKKWAFAADVVRMHALCEEGGVYLDTDIEVLKDFSPLCKHGFFSGRESELYIAASTMGAVRHHPTAELLLDWYRGRSYGRAYYTIALPRIVMRILHMCCGLEKGTEPFAYADSFIYRLETFSPVQEQGEWQVTPETYCIHHAVKSWR